MIVAGLTGGIATGKSTVSNFLSDAGARIIDADKIAREVVEQGTPAYDEIRAFFGEEILMHNGDIDRERLGDIIFNDRDKKKRLDAIVHPRVFERSAALIAEIAASEPRRRRNPGYSAAAGSRHGSGSCGGNRRLCARKIAVAAPDGPGRH